MFKKLEIFFLMILWIEIWWNETLFFFNKIYVLILFYF